MSKILAIDYGTKNIGLAISDDSQQQAFVYDTLKFDQHSFDNINEICQAELIDKIVVGLPLGLDGEYTSKTEEVVQFTKTLATQTKLIVETEDERFTSIQARKMETGQGIDESSAQIILQQYLDRNKKC